MLVDSHCHLHLINEDPNSAEIDTLVRDAMDNDVEHFLCVATDLKQTDSLKVIANRFDNVTVSVGLHPNESIDKEPSVDDLVKLSNDKKIIAIGETGLDYYRSSAKEPWQQNRFRTHIKAAIKLNKPLIIHSRDAKEDTLRILEEESANIVGGVFHCFTGDLDMALKGIEMGFLISFSGIVTFKNATMLQDVANNLPLDKIMIETDCPYLAPVPHRGKPNKPAYVKHVAKFLATLKDVSYDEFAKTTTNNFYEKFLKL